MKGCLFVYDTLKTLYLLYKIERVRERVRNRERVGKRVWRERVSGKYSVWRERESL